MSFLTRRRDRRPLALDRLAAWAWLVLGLLLMFGPVLWLGAVLVQDPRRRSTSSRRPCCRSRRRRPWSPGQPNPLPLFTVRDAGRQRARPGPGRAASASWRSMVDPANPGEPINVPIRETRAGARGRASPGRTTPSRSSASPSCATSGTRVFITIVATLITLVINSMAAFALAKYQFRGRGSIVAADHRDLDGAADDHRWCRSSSWSPSSGCSTSLWGVILAGRGDADRRVPPAPVHADHPGRAARRRAHGPCERSGRSTGASSCRSPPRRSRCSRSSRSCGAGTTSSGR